MIPTSDEARSNPFVQEQGQRLFKRITTAGTAGALNWHINRIKPSTGNSDMETYAEIVQSFTNLSVQFPYRFLKESQELGEKRLYAAFTALGQKNIRVQTQQGHVRFNNQDMSILGSFIQEEASGDILYVGTGVLADGSMYYVYRRYNGAFPTDPSMVKDELFSEASDVIPIEDEDTKLTLALSVDQLLSYLDRHPVM